MEKVLVIEDNSSVRRNIRVILEKAGFEILTAENGSEGIRLALEALPDIIICDIMMPVMDGYEVLRQLSASRTASLIPFIFLTAKVEMTDLRRGMDLGADDYLVKPFTAMDLIKAVKTRLEKRRNLLLHKNEIAQEEDKGSSLKNPCVIVAGNPPEVLKVSDIVYIQAAEGYTYIHLEEGKKIIARRLLKRWEDILPKNKFLRIHNSTIINLEYINKVEKWFNSSIRIHLSKAQEPLEVSKRYAPKIKRYLRMK